MAMTYYKWMKVYIGALLLLVAVVAIHSYNTKTKGRTNTRQMGETVSSPIQSKKKSPKINESPSVKTTQAQNDLSNQKKWNNWKVKLQSSQTMDLDWINLIVRDDKYLASYSVKESPEDSEGNYNPNITHIINPCGGELKINHLGNKPTHPNSKTISINDKSFEIDLVRSSGSGYNLGITENHFPKRKFIVKNINSDKNLVVDAYIARADIFKLNDWTILITNDRTSIIVNLESEQGVPINLKNINKIFPSSYGNIFFVSSRHKNNSPFISSIDINNIEQPLQNQYSNNSRSRVNNYKKFINIVRGNNTINVLYEINGNKKNEILLEVYDVDGNYINGTTFYNIAKAYNKQMIYDNSNKRIVIMLPQYEWKPNGQSRPITYNLYSFESNRTILKSV